MTEANGWDRSAEAWIASMGREGDWARQHVLDPAMVNRISCRGFTRALDVGCGEGRFCRILKQHDIDTVGIDPTHALIEEARRLDPSGDYRIGKAEQLELETSSFGLVVSYLSLIDIEDFRAAIQEMSRVLQPGGTLLVANLNSFITPRAAQGWVKDDTGERLHYPVDRYLDEFPFSLEWAGISIRNWHRPLGAYMEAFLDCNLQLSFFSEPPAVSGEPAHRAKHHRVPWFVLMEWRKPLVGSDDADKRKLG